MAERKSMKFDVERTRFLHVKSGRTYAIVGYAELQADVPAPNGTQIIIYQSEGDGTLWARPSVEFEDGRFKELPE